jgi:hypothetical protein
VRWLALALALAGCHHEVRQETHVVEDEAVKTAKTDESSLTKTKKSDPTDVDTKTTREDNAVVVQEPDGTMTVARVPRNKPLSLRPGAKVIGTLPLATVAVDQNKHVGGSTQMTAAENKSTETTDAQKQTKTDGKLDDVHDWGPPWKFYIAGIVVVLILIGAVYLYLRARKAVSPL